MNSRFRRFCAGLVVCAAILMVFNVYLYLRLRGTFVEAREKEVEFLPHTGRQLLIHPDHQKYPAEQIDSGVQLRSCGCCGNLIISTGTKELSLSPEQFSGLAAAVLLRSGLKQAVNRPQAE